MNSKTLIIIALVLIAALALTSGISISVAIQRGQTIRTYEVAAAAAKKAEAARKEKAHEIEKTPAADLIAHSSIADALAGARDGLADNAANRLTDAIRARAREILSSGASSAAP